MIRSYVFTTQGQRQSKIIEIAAMLPSVAEPKLFLCV